MAGDHVPIIPSSEVVGSAEMLEPLQNGPMAAKVGVIFGFTVTVVITGDPTHPLSVGVIV
jgi:hypothetical protein